MQRADSLHAFVIHDASDGKCFIHSASLFHNDRAAEDLDALLIALNDARVHVHGVADAELRNVLLEVL